MTFRPKNPFGFLIILRLTVLLISAAYLLTPHAIVRSPEHIQLSVIHMDSSNGSGMFYSWVPLQMHTAAALLRE